MVGPRGHDLVIDSVADAESLPLYTRIDGTLLIQEVEGLEQLEFLRCLGPPTVTRLRGGKTRA